MNAACLTHVALCVAAALILLPSEVCRGDDSPLVCFSLHAARQQMLAGRDIPEEVRKLGYITALRALVVDRASGDLILVGQRESHLPPVHLDDLVVALRSVYQHGDSEQPGVSLENLENPDGSVKLLARYFGGTEHTHFGKVCFEADYLLKKMSLGLESSGVPDVPNLRQIEEQESRRTGVRDPGMPGRQFFHPSVARAVASDEAVVLDQCRMAVKDMTSAGTRGPIAKGGNSPQQRFASALTEHYDEVADVHPILHELKTLMTLVTLAKGLSKLNVSPELTFWLSGYKVGWVDTPMILPGLEAGETGVVYATRVVGDVRLRALAARVQSGDPFVYARIVTMTRPTSDSLTWVIRIEKQEIAAPESATRAQAWDLLAKGDHFLERGRFRSALSFFDQVQELEPSSVEGLIGRARACVGLGRGAQALEACTHAIGVDSLAATGWSLRGMIHAELGDSTSALRDLDHALGLNPYALQTRVNRAALRRARGDLTGAQTDIDATLDQRPDYAPALALKRDVESGKREAEPAVAGGRKLGGAAPRQEAARPNEDQEAAKRQPGSSVARRSFPPAQHLGEVQHLVRFTIGVKGGYDAEQVYSPPSAAVYAARSVLRLSVPFTLTWAYRNRLRLDATVPFDIVAVPIEIPRGPWTTTVVLGSAGGMERVSLGVRCLISGTGISQTVTIGDLGILAPKNEPLFEGYINDEGSGSDPSGGRPKPSDLSGDLSGMIPWADPFWIAIAGLTADTRLAPLVRISGSAAAIVPFGAADKMKGEHWDSWGHGTNWGISGGFRFLLPDAALLSSVGFEYRRVRTVDAYRYYRGRLYPSASRTDQRIGLLMEMGDEDSQKLVSLGVNFTTYRSGAGSSSLFVTLGYGFEHHFINRWF